MIYKGIVRGGAISVEEGAVLPEGTPVEVLVDEDGSEEVTPEGYRKGSTQAVLAALDAPPQCSPEDVDALMNAIEAGKLPVNFESILYDTLKNE